MGRWQALIDELIANLAAETPGEKLRTNIDHKIREAETRASNLAAPATLAARAAARAPTPWYGHWWVWTIVGAVAIGAGAVTYAETRSPADKSTPLAPAPTDCGLSESHAASPLVKMTITVTPRNLVTPR